MGRYSSTGKRSPYREPAELPPENPLSFVEGFRLVLAFVIVAPVWFVQRWWPWLAINLGVAVFSIAFWANQPRVLPWILLAGNGFAGTVWGAVCAYRWAVRVLEGEQ